MFRYKHYFKYVICFLVIVVIGIASFICYKISNKENDIKEDVVALVVDTTDSTINDTINFYVDVKGCVNKPGVYLVSDGMIVLDAITLAGGLKTNAYTDNINLSMKLKNEMVIYVNSKSEMTVKTSTTVRNDALIVTTTTKGVLKEIKVNINTASLEELLNITGIGESKAKAIISYRESNRFELIEDVKNVPGIGDSLFEQIKDYITV